MKAIKLPGWRMEDELWVDVGDDVTHLDLAVLSSHTASHHLTNQRCPGYAILILETPHNAKQFLKQTRSPAFLLASSVADLYHLIRIRIKDVKKFPELGTRQFCRNNVTMLSGHKVVSNWHFTIFIVATPSRQWGLTIFEFFLVPDWSLRLYYVVALPLSLSRS